MEDILAIVFLFGGGTFAALAYSPVGRAWADRIRGRLPVDPEAESRHAEVIDAVDALRREVAELAERVDYAERLLTRGRGPDGGTGDAGR
jgi:hypothetical protein